MVEVLFSVSVIYILFSILIMNTLIIQCFLDNTVRFTIKKCIFSIVVFGLIVFLTGNAIVGDGVFLLFIYFIYPIIMIWEKHKKIELYSKQICIFFACDVVAIIGCAGMLSAVLYGIKNPISIYGLCCIGIMGSLYNLISIRLYMKYIRYGIAMLSGKYEGIMILIYVIVSVFALVNVTISVEGSVDFFSGTIYWLTFIYRLTSVILLILIPLLLEKGRENIYYMEQSIKNAHLLEMQLMSYNTYREAQEDTRAFRHDINNNLAFIATLMREKKYDEAEKCVKELNGNIAALSQKVVTGDDMLDTLILSKMSLIKNNNINFVIKGVIAGGLGWKALDVCTVFANLIDNAVEACQKIENIQNRYIEISFRQAGYQRIITIKNTVNYISDAIKINDNIKYTTKLDRENHGYGLQNIKNVIEKNNAMIQMKCDNMVFETDIIIMKS